MKKLLLTLLCLPMIGFGQCDDKRCDEKISYTNAVYLGCTTNDNKRNGYGELSVFDGTTYKGCWKNDKMNGQGTYEFSDGSKYVGEWKDNKMNGQGTYEDSDGSKYVGEWKDNKMNGQGTYEYSDGAVWTGLWVDGEQFEGHYEDENYYDINHIFGDVNYTIVNLHKIKSNEMNTDGYNLKLSISGIEQNFIFDTGCSGLTINKDFFYRLESAGLIEKKLKSDSAQIANNDWVLTEKYIISNIKIGDYTLNNVVISVINEGSFLCGIGVFKKFRNVQWNMAKSYLKIYK